MQELLCLPPQLLGAILAAATVSVLVPADVQALQTKLAYLCTARGEAETTGCLNRRSWPGLLGDSICRCIIKRKDLCKASRTGAGSASPIQGRRAYGEGSWQGEAGCSGRLNWAQLVSRDTGYGIPTVYVVI